MNKKLFGGRALSGPAGRSYSPPLGPSLDLRGRAPRKGRDNGEVWKEMKREEEGGRGKGRGDLPHPQQKSGCATALK